MKLSPSEIIVDRQRENADDGIKALCDSIRELGQLQPAIVVEQATGEYRVIAGRRRIRACELLGVDVDVRVADNLESAVLQLKAERDENTCRAELLLNDKARLALELEKIEKPKAEERQKANLRQGDSPSGQVATTGEGKTRDKIAEAVGVSPRTLDKLMTVAKAVEDPALSAETRAVAKDAMAEMDRTGKVDPAYKRVRCQPEFAVVDRAPKQAPMIWRDVLDAFILGARRVAAEQPIAWSMFDIAVRDTLETEKP